MSASVEHYEDLLESIDFDEGTILAVAGQTREGVAAALGIDLSQPTSAHPWEESEDEPQDTSWALLDIPGGVLAVEPTGYGDPSLAALRAASAGGAAAVVRDNIQAHLRFGCARDGEVLFDDDEFMYADDPDAVPADLRPLFDLVWDDLEGDDDEDGPSGFAVGLAMAEVVTGLRLTAEHFAAVRAETSFKGPYLSYPAED